MSTSADQHAPSIYYLVPRPQNTIKDKESRKCVGVFVFFLISKFLVFRGITMKGKFVFKKKKFIKSVCNQNNKAILNAIIRT